MGLVMARLYNCINFCCPLLFKGLVAGYDSSSSEESSTSTRFKEDIFAESATGTSDAERNEIIQENISNKIGNFSSSFHQFNISVTKFLVSSTDVERP